MSHPLTARRLLAWYARHRRDLPWRRDPDPYRVWISEIMLQQTTVAAAGPYYERFLKRFPDVLSLARAREPEVLALWSGLGYYHRARHLLAAARLVRDRHDGRVPSDPASLRALPGVGPYTAGAILSIGHGIPAAALDGNILRVSARLAGERGPVQAASTRRRLEAFLLEMMPPGAASAFNQALMDLGATVCLPARPRCGQCPIAGGCAAREDGSSSEIPVVAARPEPIRLSLTALVVTRTAAGRRIEALLVRRKAATLMGGMWEFPLAPRGAGDSKGLRAAATLAGLMGARVSGSAGIVRHTITRHALTLTIVRARMARDRTGAPLLPGGTGPAARIATPIDRTTARRWLPLEAIAGDAGGGAITGAARKIARRLIAEG